MTLKITLLFGAAVLSFTAAAMPLGLGLESIVYALFVFTGVLLCIHFYNAAIKKKIVPTSQEKTKEKIAGSNVDKVMPYLRKASPEKIPSPGWRISSFDHTQKDISQPLFQSNQDNGSGGKSNSLATTKQVLDTPEPTNTIPTVEVVDIEETPSTRRRNKSVFDEPAVIIEKPKYDQEYWRKKVAEEEEREQRG